MNQLPPPSPQILRRQIERLLEARGDRPTSLLAIRASGAWNVPPRLEVGAYRCHLVFCPSALAFREQLTQPRPAGEVQVLLTDRPEAELGLDVLARLPGRRLYEIDRWDLLQRAFGAARLDSRLLENDWLAAELLAAAPPQGYRSPASGTLDLETAWRAIFEHRLALPEGRTEAGDLLLFAESAAAALWARLPAPMLAAAIARIGQESGPAAAAIAHLLGSGRAADAAPIGLIFRVLFDPSRDGEAERRLALVRLEPLLGEVPPAAAALRWAAAAESLLLAVAEAAPAALQRILARADQLLESIKAAPWAGLSAHLRSGLQHRRERLAVALEAAVATAQPAAFGELAAAAQALEEHHRQGHLEAVPVEALAALCRWLASAETAAFAASSFLEACHHYAEILAPIDQARGAVRRFATRLGDARFEQAVTSLLSRVTAARERQNGRFGELAAGYFAAGAAGDAEVVAIEEVLPRVLVPLARAGPVLLLVLDGLALATFLDLLPDLRNHGWSELIPAAGRRQLALAALPTISEVCRASLLGGRLERGQQAYEKKAFASDRRLRDLGAPNLPPLLFHQAELRAEGGVGLAETVRAEVLRVQRRVVAAVINAVDDHLAKGEQIHHDWTVANIKPLGACCRRPRRLAARF